MLLCSIVCGCEATLVAEKSAAEAERHLSTVSFMQFIAILYCLLSLIDGYKDLRDAAMLTHPQNLNVLRRLCCSLGANTNTNCHLMFIECIINVSFHWMLLYASLML